MNLAAQETLDSLNGVCPVGLDRFDQIYTRALKKMGSPVFFEPRYENHMWECASNIPNWLPRVLTACATTESSGSRALLDIWKRVQGHKKAEEGLLRHARDEAGHAQFFVRLAHLVFPESYDQGYLSEVQNCLHNMKKSDLSKSDKNIVSDRLLIDYLIQLNIVEMRTRFHLLKLAPMFFSLADQSAKPKVENYLNLLARDELHHISYTAELIDEWAKDDDIDRLVDVYACRLQCYHQHTLDQVEEMKKAFPGTFPDLL